MLDQACAHCPIFPTAASRRSLGRVSVPVWLIILSDQLPIVALVSHYPTNQLIGRRLIPQREAQRSPAFLSRAHAVLAWVSPGCPPLPGRSLRVTHPSATRGPSKLEPPVRLACVRHAASVQSEPGSNSSVQLQTLTKTKTKSKSSTPQSVPQTRELPRLRENPPTKRKLARLKPTTRKPPPQLPVRTV